MSKQDNIDLKIILSFINHYQNLYENGQIKEKQLNIIRELLDNYQNYTPETFTRMIKENFDHSPEQD